MEPYRVYIFQNVRARAVIFSTRLAYSIINEDIKSIDNLIGEIPRWMFYC